MASASEVLKSDGRAVTSWLEQHFSAQEKTDNPHKSPRLIKAMRYSILNGGKRLRASLLLSAARLALANLYGTDLKNAPSMSSFYGVAGAVEMIHAYSLIHDDLPAMDDAELRRGSPSCHKAFDEVTAILAGDALQSEAFAVLSRPGLCANPDAQLQLINLLAQASGQAGMAGGQMFDLLASETVFNLPEIRMMQEMKTGALIHAAAMMGVVGVGADQTLFAAVGNYANWLGFAFQIADDLLDYQADTKQIGKPVRRDLTQGKASFIDHLGLDKARKKAEDMVDKACAALADYGPASDELVGLARFAIDRNS